MNQFLSAVIISGGGSNGFVGSLIFLIVCALILGLLLWLVSIIPIIPAVFRQVLTFVIYAVAVVILINFLLGLVGKSFIAY